VVMAEALLTATTPYSEALGQMTTVLEAAGLAEARREARILLCAVLGVGAEILILAPDAPLGSAAPAVQDALRRRSAREPLARITGHREFFGLDMELARSALIPRPDTETLVEAVLDELGQSGRDQDALSLLDLGTGSGAILTALLSRLPQAGGVGVDRTIDILPHAARNCARHCGTGRALFIAGNWTDALGGTFDVIVSNPPYIATADIAGLDPEVRDHDPRLALDGGSDGYAAYRALARAIPPRLAPGGLVGLELGAGQASTVRAIFAAAGLGSLSCKRDLGGHERALLLRRA